MFHEIKHVAISVLVLMPFLMVSAADAEEPGTKPSIVFIYADDLGFGDLGCHGHPRDPDAASRSDGSRGDGLLELYGRQSRLLTEPNRHRDGSVSLAGGECISTSRRMR